MALFPAQSHGLLDIDLATLSKRGAYLKITAEISRLESQIWSLRSLCNSIAPVASLPTELLSKVFMHCCDLNESGEFTNLRGDETDDEDDPKAPDDSPLDMRLVVSWVSRHWRSVALGHKSLWNLVCNTGYPRLAYAKACIERCQCLYIDAERPSFGFLDLCTSRISQISYLKFKGPFEYPTDFTWPPCAPLLQNLVLCEDVPPSLLETITPELCPRLHSLVLEDFDIDWDLFPPIPSTITKLLIMYPTWPTTISKFLALFNTMQSLTECQVYSCIEDGGVDDGTPLHPVHLPRLQTMLISDSLPATIKLVSNIIAPGAVIVLNPEEGSEQGIKTLFRALRLSHGHIWGCIRHIRWTLRLTASYSSSRTKHTVSLRHFSPSQIVLAFQSLELKNLVSIWMRHPSPGVLALLSELPKLRSISLESRDALNEFIAFFETNSTSSEPCFPVWRLLYIFNIPTGSREWLDDIYRILAARNTLNMGVEKVEFIRCEGIGVEDVVRFREVVGHVRVGERLL